jgi:FkbH-like protein
MSAQEKIRLVIWDLDETFWHGTLSEGGIRQYVRAHHDIVVALAMRGILSSICSKNDLSAVAEILTEQGLWDYFVFPSVDWTAKGPRLRQLIADIQLRPETVLFVDDNASNRAEAAAHVPGLQISGEEIIAGLLANEFMQGKPDPELSRLKQYQLLQRRKADEKSAGSDNKAFLRASHIQVIVDPDVEANLDRAIELINRTNQLNFTKLRLPDDKASAEAELLTVTRHHSNQAGLIRVWDDYGDHGICGFYVTKTNEHGKELLHFCFSCRILGMGVEQWLYEKLGKPWMKISDDVRLQLDGDVRVDWINQDLGGAVLFAEGFANAPPPSFAGQQPASLAPEIRLHGSCELHAVSHYLQQETPSLAECMSYTAGAFQVRRDETTNLGLFLSGMDDATKAEIDIFGLFRPQQDLDIFNDPPPGTFFVLATLGDIYLPVYRHNRLGFKIELSIWGGFKRRPELAGSDVRDAIKDFWDLTRVDDDKLVQLFDQYTLRPELQDQVRRVADHVRANYTYLGPASHDDLSRNLVTILDRIPRSCPVAVLLPNCPLEDDPFATMMFHGVVRDSVARFPNVFAVDPGRHIAGPEDQQDTRDHFDRMVYFSMYKELVALCESHRQPASASPEIQKSQAA